MVGPLIFPMLDLELEEPEEEPGIVGIPEGDVGAGTGAGLLFTMSAGGGNFVSCGGAWHCLHK